MSIITENDHVNLSAFLGHVLDDYKAAGITKLQAVSGLAHLMAALDEGEAEEVKSWVREGRICDQTWRAQTRRGLCDGKL